MYTFRFNPVFEQWVLLGEPVPQTLLIQEAHKILPLFKEAPDFYAATYPGQPFILDHPATKKHVDDLLYAPQAPVGEYEVILYTGKTPFKNWTQKEWQQWLALGIERFRQLHLNPYLHFVTLKLFTRSLMSAGDEHQRVGDLIAASHPLSGMSAPVSAELIEKLLKKEQLFVVDHSTHGSLYIPTAPLHHHEIWYLPKGEHHIDTLPAAERTALATTLAHTFSILQEEFPEEHWVMTVHTPMASTEEQGQWWIQIHQETAETSPLKILPLPERFTFLMRQLLSHRAAH
jgi:hypothetical protein